MLSVEWFTVVGRTVERPTRNQGGGYYAVHSDKANDRRIEYVKRFASKDAADEAGDESESDDEMSSVGSYASGDDEEPAGHMDGV